MAAQKSDILGVLGGSKAAKVEISIDPMSLVYVGLALVISIAAGIFLGSLIKQKK